CVGFGFLELLDTEYPWYDPPVPYAGNNSVFGSIMLNNHLYVWKIGTLDPLHSSPRNSLANSSLPCGGRIEL
ncbi:unnamed protein product, partial [Rhizoctonia solani]